MNVHIIKIRRPDSICRIGVASVYQPGADLQLTHEAFLHPLEACYVDSLKTCRAQRNYLAGRYAAKKAIAAYTDCTNLGKIHIGRGVFGQPVLQIPDVGNLQVSISQTDFLGIALVFPEGHPMGIAAEQIRSKKMAAIQPIVTPNDQLQLPFLHKNTTAGMVLLRTIKRALSKVIGSEGMDSFELFELASVEQINNIVVSNFRHFSHYKSFSWVSGKYACSMVLPTSSRADLAFIEQVRSNLISQTKRTASATGPR
jgi:4'-phosphopantetheinyl transferase EntD